MLYVIPSHLLLLVVTHPCPLLSWEQRLAAVLGGAMSPGTSLMSPGMSLVVGSPCVFLSPWRSSSLRSPSSRPPPTVVLLVLPVEPESSIVVVGFWVVRRGDHAPPSCWSWVLMSVADIVSSVHPRSTLEQCLAGLGVGARPFLVVGWLSVIEAGHRCGHHHSMFITSKKKSIC
ncbi:hypothetical protein L208DRAFT_1419883 [Tricholoma matsutake]|nr:hypothetical protein L208DRAFT_1419883 [Tricholoma matsutake 945]